MKNRKSHVIDIMQRSGRIRKTMILSIRNGRMDRSKLVGLGKPMLDPLKPLYSRICISFMLSTVGRHWGLCDSHDKYV